MRMKIKMIILILAIFLLSVVIAGCGTLDMNFHTIVKPSGDFTQQIKIEGSGMLGELLEEMETEETIKQEGWEITTKRTEDSIILTGTKDFRRDEPMIFGNETMMENVTYRVNDNLFIKEYFYEVTIPGGGPIGAGTEDEFSELGDAMLEDMFNLSWTFTLPGKITKSNADVVEGNSATWYLDIESFENDHYLMVQSKLINWPVIAGIGAGVVIIIGLIIFFIVRARRRWA
jgi:hypothetical protein